MIPAATNQASSGRENMRMTQLTRPRQGIRGKNGALKVVRFGTFFLSLIAEV